MTFEYWLPLSGFLAALAALITAAIAIAAFCVAKKQLSEFKREREQGLKYNKLSLLPAVVLVTDSYYPAERLGIRLLNVGNGPAIITDLIVSFNGVSLNIIDQENWVVKLADHLAEKDGKGQLPSATAKTDREPLLRNVGNSTLSKKTPFGVSQEFWVLYMKTKGRSLQEVETFQNILKGFHFRVCYMSVYGNKFDTDDPYDIPIVE